MVSRAEEEVIRIRPVLSFRDGKLENFDKLMAGVRGGETRQGEAELTDEAPNAALRGKKVATVFEVLEVKRLELPELTPEFLLEMGGFKSVAELRDAIKREPRSAAEVSAAAARPRANHRKPSRGGQLGLAAAICSAARAAASCSGRCWSCSGAGSATKKSGPARTSCGRTSWPTPPGP